MTAAEARPRLLYASRWLPDPNGGGTQQRAALHLKALAAFADVHLLYLGGGDPGLAAALAPLVRSVTSLEKLRERHGAAVLAGSRWRLSWGMSGNVVRPSRRDVLAIEEALPVKRFDAMFAFHLGPALVANALPICSPGSVRIIDWDFLESPNVMQIARRARAVLGPARWLSAQANRLKLRAAEAAILGGWDVHLCSSSTDMPWLAKRCQEGALVQDVPNVSPAPDISPTHSSEACPTLIFVGTMGYEPNADAARHFVADIWPRVRRVHPDARLLIVGRSAPPEVRALGGQDGVEVHVDVPSLQPLYAQAHLAIAPLRFAVGSNLKIPEAMAHGRALVGYAHACERHGVRRSGAVIPVESVDEFVSVLVDLLASPSRCGELGDLAYRDHQASQAGLGVEARHAALLRSAVMRNQAERPLSASP